MKVVQENFIIDMLKKLMTWKIILMPNFLTYAVQIDLLYFLSFSILYHTHRILCALNIDWNHFRVSEEIDMSVGICLYAMLAGGDEGWKFQKT